MSRTRRKAKSIGLEYWSRRPFNKFGGIVGPFTKRRTHKAERQIGRQGLMTEIEDGEPMCWRDWMAAKNIEFSLMTNPAEWTIPLGWDERDAKI